ncbi:hypothetical protein GVAV_000386 [Gurleya vavrai]
MVNTTNLLKNLFENTIEEAVQPKRPPKDNLLILVKAFLLLPIPLDDLSFFETSAGFVILTLIMSFIVSFFASRNQRYQKVGILKIFLKIIANTAVIAVLHIFIFRILIKNNEISYLKFANISLYSFVYLPIAVVLILLIKKLKVAFMLAYIGVNIKFIYSNIVLMEVTTWRIVVILCILFCIDFADVILMISLTNQ